jgi:hypothetical protein
MPTVTNRVDGLTTKTKPVQGLKTTWNPKVAGRGKKTTGLTHGRWWNPVPKTTTPREGNTLT